MERCKLCGGNVGNLNENGVHNLCEARAKLGLLTPSLGDRCLTCEGRKTLGTGGVFLSLSLGPSDIKKSIDAQFPPCPDCKGTGIAQGSK